MMEQATKLIQQHDAGYSFIGFLHFSPSKN
jgi:hypothetical protein